MTKAEEVELDELRRIGNMQWESLKRLWDGKPPIQKRAKNQHFRNIDESWIPSRSDNEPDNQGQ